MKKLILLGIMLAVTQGSILALLPPLYEDMSEISNILTTQELGGLIPSGESIIAIQKNDHGYLVYTTNYKVQANVVYTPRNRPGPAQFDIVFESPIKNKKQ
jgi:hypothetical protein